MRARGLRVGVWLETRADRVPPPLLALMKQAGVHTVALGLTRIHPGLETSLLFATRAIIVHVMSDLRTRVLGRILAPAVEHALNVFPVVVLTGARQTGKTTLVRHLPSAAGRAYRTLDDLRVLDLAQREPDLLVGEADRMTLDEVQRAPDLLRAVKRAVDERRRPGRFLLTGSANLLLMQAVSETLAGRAVYLRLGPMTESEKAGRPDPGPWGELLAAPGAEAAVRILGDRSSTDRSWSELAAAGGLPPILSLAGEDRAMWLEGYVATYLERDLRQLAEVTALADFRRFLQVAALRLGQLLNRAELGRDAALSRATAQRWLALLEISYQVRLLAPYSVSRTKRLVRTPKLYWGDTGLAAHLAGLTGPAGIRACPQSGAWLENLLLVHLDAWRETLSPRPELLYWRTADGDEVDFVIEHRRRLLPLEVKAGSRLGRGDLGPLERFLADYPAAPFGLLAYGGAEVYRPAPRVIAVPWAALLA